MVNGIFESLGLAKLFLPPTPVLTFFLH